MKFSTPLILLASLLALVSGEADAPRSHARDFSIEIRDAGVAHHEIANIQKRNPVIPPGKDATKLHAWIRLDTRTIEYDRRGGANHDGLNQLMKDTGGKHVDVVIGNSKGFEQYGLEFADQDWQSTPNGDGYPVINYREAYLAAPNEVLTYKGQVDGRKTLESIQKSSNSLIAGKVYNHQTYNCATFANDLVSSLNVR